MNNPKFLLLFTSLVSVVQLSGCEDTTSYAQVCSEHPEICEEFHEDSWCKKERLNVGMANYQHVLANSDENKFTQLIAYENYEKCVSHASKIEHIKLKEKKTRRIENMMKAKARIEEISTQTANSEHPRLLYYHWTRYLNEASLEKFLALEGTKALATPESQYELATYYTKIDQDKTLQLLFHALELYPEDAEINDEIFKSLSSIFAKRKNYKQAYIWLKILSLYDPEDIDIKNNTVENFALGYHLDADFLNKVAESTLDKITSGNFVPPKF